ncbi:MAG: nitrite/sulfite reductase [Rhodobacteraceae bacterium]|nr:nitrite/sulfite reductase [Paracoccaceae bacterium]
MYQYDEFDRAFIAERNRQFRAQVDHRIDGSLTEEEFRPLRLMNGLYLQLHAYMLRVAIPYGTLNSAQLRQLAMIATRWDKGYGHFTTRQNIQYNWPRLTDVPDILDALAEVGLHAIQTSGNTIRNVTSDQFAAAAADEIDDPRPYAELIRQWSTDHPEFQFLPRKFKIAITGSPNDRAVTKAHDIGLRMVRHGNDTGFEVIVGGGLGRTPMIGKVIRDFLPVADLLPYLEAIVGTYNLLGRRDNKYKARIKITVHENGLEKVRDLVEAQFHKIAPQFDAAATAQHLAQLKQQFAAPDLPPRDDQRYHDARRIDGVFRAWADTNLHPHRVAGYSIVTISLKPHGGTPGDATDAQMTLIADLADRYAQGEIRVSHEQNLVLPHVALDDLPDLHAALRKAGLATANVGLASDIIACPGMDYCALATARSIPVAQEIAQHVDALKLEHDIGPLKIKISGCINACGHHHVGHIGILGLDRAGVENYQITLGGDGSEDAVIGTRTGPGFAYDQIVPAVERILRAYLDLRRDRSETFLQAYRRLGADPFKAALYHTEQEDAA